MHQILDPKIPLSIAAWLGVSLVLLSAKLGLSLSTKAVVSAVDFFILSVMFANPVWRFVWNRTGFIGRWLSRKIYPDLNGTYDVLLESNWPVVKQMLDAARKEALPFNPFDLDQPSPPLLSVELEAVIAQSWFEIKMCMRPKKPGAVIERSETLATVPTKDAGNGEKGLVYVFRQENASRAATDDPFFEGATRLRIDRTDQTILTGEYWNNRAWHRGINAAGKLRLVRRSAKTKNT